MFWYRFLFVSFVNTPNVITYEAVAKTKNINWIVSFTKCLCWEWWWTLTTHMFRTKIKMESRGYRFCSTNKPQPCLDPPKSERRDGEKQINELYYGVPWRSCSGVPRGRVNSIRRWPLRRDDDSGVLIGAGGTQRSDWPARVLANDVLTRIDR